MGSFFLLNYLPKNALAKEYTGKYTFHWKKVNDANLTFNLSARTIKLQTLKLGNGEQRYYVFASVGLTNTVSSKGTVDNPKVHVDNHGGFIQSPKSRYRSVGITVHKDRLSNCNLSSNWSKNKINPNKKDTWLEVSTINGWTAKSNHKFANDQIFKVTEDFQLGSQKNNIVCWYVPENIFKKLMSANNMEIEQMKKCKSEKKRTLYSSCIMQGFRGNDGSKGKSAHGRAYCYTKAQVTSTAGLGARSEYNNYYNNKLVLPYQTDPIKLEIRSYQITSMGLIRRINTKAYNFSTDDFPYDASYKFVKGTAKGSNSEYQYKVQKTYIDPDSNATYYLYDAKKVNSHTDSYSSVPGKTVIQKQISTFKNVFKQMVAGKTKKIRDASTKKYNNWYTRLATTSFSNIHKNFYVALFYKNPTYSKVTINYYKATLDTANHTGKVTLSNTKVNSPQQCNTRVDIGAQLNFVSNIGEKQVNENPIRLYAPKTANVTTTYGKSALAKLVAVTAQEGSNKYALIGQNLNGNYIDMISGVTADSVASTSGAYSNYINALYSKKCKADAKGTTINCYYAIPPSIESHASVEVIYKNLSNPITDANGNVVDYKEVSNQYTKKVTSDATVGSTISLINSTTKNSNQFFAVDTVKDANDAGRDVSLLRTDVTVTSTDKSSISSSKVSEQNKIYYKSTLSEDTKTATCISANMSRKYYRGNIKNFVECVKNMLAHTFGENNSYTIKNGDSVKIVVYYNYEGSNVDARYQYIDNGVTTDSDSKPVEDESVVNAVYNFGVTKDRTINKTDVNWNITDSIFEGKSGEKPKEYYLAKIDIYTVKYSDDPSGAPIYGNKFTAVSSTNTDGNMYQFTEGELNTLKAGKGLLSGIDITEYTAVHYVFTYVTKEDLTVRPAIKYVDTTGEEIQEPWYDNEISATTTGYHFNKDKIRDRSNGKLSQFSDYKLVGYKLVCSNYKESDFLKHVNVEKKTTNYTDLENLATNFGCKCEGENYDSSYNDKTLYVIYEKDPSPVIPCIKYINEDGELMAGPFEAKQSIMPGEGVALNFNFTDVALSDGKTYFNSSDFKKYYAWNGVMYEADDWRITEGDKESSSFIGNSLAVYDPQKNTSGVIESAKQEKVPVGQTSATLWIVMVEQESPDTPQFFSQDSYLEKELDTQNQSAMNATAEITNYETKNNQAYDIHESDGGIPTTDSVYTQSTTNKYNYGYKFKNHNETASIPVKFVDDTGEVKFTATVYREGNLNTVENLDVFKASTTDILNKVLGTSGKSKIDFNLGTDAIADIPITYKKGGTSLTKPTFEKDYLTMPTKVASTNNESINANAESAATNSNIAQWTVSAGSDSNLGLVIKCNTTFSNETMNKIVNANVCKKEIDGEQNIFEYFANCLYTEYTGTSDTLDATVFVKADTTDTGDDTSDTVKDDPLTQVNHTFIDNEHFEEFFCISETALTNDEDEKVTDTDTSTSTPEITTEEEITDLGTLLTSTNKDTGQKTESINSTITGYDYNGEKDPGFTVPTELENIKQDSKAQTTYIRAEEKKGEDLTSKHSYGEKSYTFDVNCSEVYVHTPVLILDNGTYSKDSLIQLVNYDSSKCNVTLGKTITTQPWNTGEHKGASGYEIRDYLKYADHITVSFPFEVKSKSNGKPDGTSNDKYYPAGEEIEIYKKDYESTDECIIEPQSFEIPLWTPTGDYDIAYTVYAVNCTYNHKDAIEDDANKSPANYAARTYVPITVSGNIYGLQIYDISDYGDGSKTDQSWRNVFRKPGSLALTGNTYTVGTKGFNGEANGHTEKSSLPLIKGSHPTLDNAGVLSTGYAFRYKFTTTGSLTGLDSMVNVKPKFYYVNKDGTQMQEIDLWYSETLGNRKLNLVKIGSSLDKLNTKTLTTGDQYLSIPKDEITRTSNLIGISESSLSSITKTAFTFGDIKLPYNVRMFTGATKQGEKTDAGQLPYASDATISKSKQTWYGEYYLPSQVHACAKGYDVASYATTRDVDYSEGFWLKNGYIVVNFELVTLNSGIEELSYNPGLNGTTDMWDHEAFKPIRIDSTGSSFQFNEGDMVLYDTDSSLAEVYRSAGTH